MTGLRDALISCGAVRFGEFTLASGARSDYYVDIKRASTDPAVLRLLGEGFAKRVGGAHRIAGMELGAVPLAAVREADSGDRDFSRAGLMFLTMVLRVLQRLRLSNQ